MIQDVIPYCELEIKKAICSFNTAETIVDNLLFQYDICFDNYFKYLNTFRKEKQTSFTQLKAIIPEIQKKLDIWDSCF
jgi:hypothetical protein